MSRRVFRFPPGVCVCILEHSYRESQRANVVRASRAEALLEPVPGLNEGDCLSVSIKFNDGTKIPLLARVRASSEKGVILRWLYNQPHEESLLDSTFKRLASGTVASASPGNASPPFRGEAILSRAQTVESKELAARHEQLHVLDMATINDLIEEAVSEAVEGLTRSVPEEEKKRLLEEAEESFNAKLRSFRAEKADLESRAWKLQHQLEQAQKVLDEERARVIDAESFTVSEDGLEVLERRFNHLLQRTVTRGGVDATVEQEMKGIFDRLLDGERQRISEQVQEAHNDTISLLERKVQRLARTLEDAEKERDTARKHAAALEAVGGSGFYHLGKAGLSEDDPAREKKLELLKEIYEQNKEMRDSLLKAGRLPTTKRKRSSPPTGRKAPPASTGTATAARDDGDSSHSAGGAAKSERIEGDQQPAETAPAEPPPEVDESGYSGAASRFVRASSNGESEEIDDSIDPDDLPWAPDQTPRGTLGEHTESGIKRVKARRVKPPPLHRTV